MKAIELTGTIDEKGHLCLDSQGIDLGQGRVRVIVLQDEPEMGEQEWLEAAARNSAFEFLGDPAEDIYKPTDGKPFNGQG